MDSEARSKAIKAGVAGLLLVIAAVYLIWAMQPKAPAPEELPQPVADAPEVTNFQRPKEFSSSRVNPELPPSAMPQGDGLD